LGGGCEFPGFCEWDITTNNWQLAISNEKKCQAISGTDNQCCWVKEMDIHKEHSLFPLNLLSSLFNLSHRRHDLSNLTLRH
jgi:hypothetical protein